MMGEERLFDSMSQVAKSSISFNDNDVGKITNLEPIEVMVKGYLLRDNNLIINPYLLDHTVNFTNLTGSTGNGTINIDNGSFFVPSTLQKGDRVVLIELDNGKYYLASKAGD